MESISISETEKLMRPKGNKGFTLLEMLLVLFIISAFYLLSLRQKPLSSLMYEKKLLVSTFALTQNDALYFREMQIFEYKDIDNRFEIHFNSRGNINLAQSFEFLDMTDFVIWLGCGRIHEKK